MEDGGREGFQEEVDFELGPEGRGALATRRTGCVLMGSKAGRRRGRSPVVAGGIRLARLLVFFLGEAPRTEEAWGSVPGPWAACPVQ